MDKPDGQEASSRSHSASYLVTSTKGTVPRRSNSSYSRKIPKYPSSKHSKSKGRKTLADCKREDNDDEKDTIVFINIDSSEGTLKTTRQQLQPEDILKKCGESDYRQVYQIDLRSCALSEIPNLEKFCKVRQADLSCNHITRISQLECCTDLRELKLYGNEIEKIQKLELLTQLNNLQLQYNCISLIGKGLASCRKLTFLRLDSNKLTSLDAKEIASLSQLAYLDLSNNNLEDVNALNCLPNLQELSVANNRIKKLQLSRCKKELDVSGNKITDLSCFSPLSAALRILNVSKNSISKLEPSGALSVLEELYISCNTLKKLQAVPIKFPAIQILDVKDNRITDSQELTHLKSCPDLRELYVSSNPFGLDLEDRSGGNIHEILPPLKVIDGVEIKKQSIPSQVPLMRPMSASTAISSRQVKAQLDSLDSDMQRFQQSLEDKFRDINFTINSIQTNCASDRPVSRASRRSRIMEAQMFAMNQYGQENSSC